MSQALEYHEKVDRILERLDKVQEAPVFMERGSDGTYRPITQDTKQIQPYNFGEQIFDTRSDTSIIGEAVGSGLAGTVYGLISGFVPGGMMLPPAFVTAGAGWALGKYVLKRGFGHSIARGIMIAGIFSFISPMVGQLTSGILGGIGGGTTPGGVQGTTTSSNTQLQADIPTGTVT